MNETRLLALAGSLRRDSYNRKALVVLAQGAREAGAEVTTVDLRDFPMPIYDADWEAAQGLPGPARALQQLLHEHDGLLGPGPSITGSSRRC